MKPRLALLSSIDLCDKKGSLACSECKQVEVYAFMKWCLESLFPGEPYDSMTGSRSALKVMALARTVELESARIAKAVHESSSGSEVVGISTFLPEIAAHNRYAAAWISAQEALKFLIEVAAELRSEYGHPCSTVEFVGGSCLDGVWRLINGANKISYIVNRLPREKAIARLLTRLEPIAEFAAEHSITLALELEPGPLFTVGDWESLVMFCEAVENKSGVLHDFVGINLDIAHWAILSGITPRMVYRTPQVLNRIVHSHICDHSIGHLSDAIPSMFHAASDFIPWLELLTTLEKRGGTRPKFSGFISCELEAAHSIDHVALSTRNVQHWLDYCCPG
jgi:sugar phosphate isomerase/epimerase